MDNHQFKGKQMPDPDASQPIPISTSYVCAYIIQRQEKGFKFLLMKRKSRYMFGLWGQVAGKVEPGETAVQAIIREIKEETGQTPSSLYSVDIVETFYDIEYNKIQMIPVFMAELPSPEVTLSHEHSEYMWLPTRKAREMFPFPQQRQSVDLIVREFLERDPEALLKVPIPQ